MKIIITLMSIMLLCCNMPVNAESNCNAFAIYHTQCSESDVTLSWDAPNTNTDGTPLTDLAGYRIYVGRATGVYDAGIIDVGNVLTITLTAFCEGTYYFVATAYDTEDNESDYSNEVSKTFNIAPGSPGGLR